MKVKIGDKIYDSNIQPIVVILKGWEKTLIGHMQESDHNFCSFPETYTRAEIEEFMKT